LIMNLLSENSFVLRLTKCEWILVLRQVQHERVSTHIGNVHIAQSVVLAVNVNICELL
jgi:hypothetical protein